VARLIKNELPPSDPTLVALLKLGPPAPTVIVYVCPGVTAILFFHPRPPPPPPPELHVDPPPPPPPTATALTDVIPAGTVQVYVPGVVYSISPAGVNGMFTPVFERLEILPTVGAADPFIAVHVI
jgi:hypothetical protein